MNGFDYIALASLAAAALNGFRQGLAKEFYRLLRLAVALITGGSLFGAASRLIQATGIGAGWSDSVTFVGITVGVWMLLRSLRSWIESWLSRRVPKKAQSLGGAVAALIKDGILLLGVIATFHMATWLPGHALVARDSIAARVARPFLPDLSRE